MIKSFLSKPSPKYSHNGDGFTVVEVLIATAVFSIVLTVLLAGIMSFSNSFYKASNVAATQSVARNIMDTLTQAIQFDPAKSTRVGIGTSVNVINIGAANFQCMGGYVFVYSIGSKFNGTTGWETDDGAVSPGFFSKQVFGCPDTIDGSNPNYFYDNTDPMNPVLLGKQFLSDKMRIGVLDIEAVEDVPNAYTVSLQVAFGDDDVLCNSVANCSDPNSSPDLESNTPLSCRPGVGNRFCAVSALVSTVQRRLE